MWSSARRPLRWDVLLPDRGGIGSHAGQVQRLDLCAVNVEMATRILLAGPPLFLAAAALAPKNDQADSSSSKGQRGDLSAR